MSGSKVGRGRPKGTGLNDRAQLAAIRKLLDRDPSLKPTTAIKLAGVTDPSAVRRLRDKLAAPQVAASPEAALPKTHAPDAVPAAVQMVPKTAPAAAATRTATRADSANAASSLPPGEAVASGPSSSPSSTSAFANAGGHSANWLASISGLGLRALSATFELQWALIGQALRSPPVTAALKQQLLLNELTLSFCVPYGEFRRTLH